jgi:hypothetical protein
METQDYRWAAGILEGEGCFSIFQRKGKDYSQVSVLCEMTDQDTIEKLQKELGVGRVSRRAPRPSRKDTWLLAVQKQQDVFDTLIRVMPYLGKRRLKKAQELFNYLEPIVCK